MKVKIRNTGLIVDEGAAPDIYEEMRKGSITPTSFDYREFVSDIAEPTYIESYLSGRVMRFGINSATLIPEPRVYDPSSASGTGRSSASSSTKFSEIARKVIHHSAEKFVFNQALDYLFASAAQAVICDILVREKGVITSWPAEVHSVILYKNPPEADGRHKITIIDPSNLQYSNHLSNDDIKASCPHPMLDSIVSFLTPLQIYKPYRPTGYGTDMHRDCVDIAVKLAFGFNNSAPVHILTADHIKTNPVVVAISNIIDIDESFTGKVFPVRVKQTSDPASIIEFKRLEDTIFKDLTILRTIKEKALDRINSYDQIVAKATGQMDYDTFVSVKASKAGVMTRLQSILDKEAGLETEYITLLAGAFDSSCFTPINDFEATLHGVAITLFDQLDL